MRISFKRILHILLCVSALTAILTVGAKAYSYPNMPASTETVTVTIGNVTLPLKEYIDGDYWSPDKVYMTASEAAQYGINRSSSIYLRGSQCVGFGRYVYTALFYKYPQNATIDNQLGYSYGSSYAYTNMIEQVLGTKTLAPGYNATTLKTLFTACRPGAIMRINGHTMILMAIYNDGCLIYDANFSSSNEVDVRSYTWQSFVDKLGYRGIEALHMPTYYPGYTYGIDTTGYTLQLDESTAGTYVVYNCTQVNVRSGPSTYTSKVTTIPAGEKVTVDGTYGNWAAVTIDGVRRWIYMDYLRGDVLITYDGNGGTVTHTTLAGVTSSGASLQYAYNAGRTIGTLPTAVKKDRNFLGWYHNDTKYTASSTVPGSDTTLTAKWGILSYTDVPEGIWYQDYVIKGNQIGLISTDTVFRPDDPAYRCEFVTILAREYQRSNKTTIQPSSGPFTDLEKGSYYENFVNWGYSTGLVMGIDNTTFAPKDIVTREQVATLLYRYAMYSGYVAKDAVQDHTLLDKFSDGGSVNEYALDSMSWCVSVGILEGSNTGELLPQGPCLRSHMVTMMVRFIDLLANMPVVASETSTNAETLTSEPTDSNIPEDNAESAAPEEDAAAPENDDSEDPLPETGDESSSGPLPSTPENTETPDTTIAPETETEEAAVPENDTEEPAAPVSYDTAE